MSDVYKCGVCGTPGCKVEVSSFYDAPHGCLYGNKGRTADWREVEDEPIAKVPTWGAWTKELPDWCKIGALAYGDGRYGKITGINRTDGKIDIGETGHFIPVEDCAEARIRPYNSDEMRELVGKVIETKRDSGLITGYRGVENKVFVGLNNRYTAEELLAMNATFSDGSPCGVLEHFDATREEFVR